MLTRTAGMKLKALFLPFCAILAVSMASCSEDDDPTIPSVPVFPTLEAWFDEDYLGNPDSWAEVAACSPSNPHGPRMRVHISPAEADSLFDSGEDLDAPFAVGTTIVATEYPDDACSEDPVRVTVMRKTSAEGTPKASQWEWQEFRFDEEFEREGDLYDCINCHTNEAVCGPASEITCSESISLDPCYLEVTEPPVATIEGSFSFGNTRTPFMFDASASVDPSCPERVLAYRWDLDSDGVIDFPPDGSWSSDPILEPDFPAVGSYVVAVEVTSDPDAEPVLYATATMQVEVVDREYASITTWMGTGVAGYSEEGLPLRETNLFTPMDLEFSGDGTPYIVDWNNHKILSVQGERAYTIAGTGLLGDALEGMALATGLNHPTHVAVDPDGKLALSAWHNSMVMRIDPIAGTLVRLAGIRPDSGTNSNRCYEPSDEGGAAVEACLNLPSATAYDSQGNLYIADQKNTRVVRVGAVNGRITDHSETGTRSIFETVVGVPCLDPSDPSAENCPDGGYNGNGILASEAFLRTPGLQSADPTSRIAIHDDVLYLVDTENHQLRSVDLTQPDPTIELVAGSTQLDAFGRPLPGAPQEDVPAAGTPLNRPCDLAVDADGNIFIADTKNNVVRRVDAATGLITTVAGSGSANPPCMFNGQCDSTDGPAFGDGSDSLEAFIALPYGIALDPDGNLYVVDTYHHRIRVIYR